MDSLQISSSPHGKIVLITVRGNIDAENAKKFYSKLNEQMSKGFVQVVCNMEKLEFIASAGIGKMIEVKSKLEKDGGGIKISCMNDKIKKIFKVMGMINLFKIYDSDKEAIESF
jgi:anti-sigma B factor antagonist